jgi:hypothetical protein
MRGSREAIPKVILLLVEIRDSRVRHDLFRQRIHIELRFQDSLLLTERSGERSTTNIAVGYCGPRRTPVSYQRKNSHLSKTGYQRSLIMACLKTAAS